MRRTRTEERLGDGEEGEAGERAVMGDERINRGGSICLADEREDSNGKRRRKDTREAERSDVWTIASSARGRERGEASAETLCARAKGRKGERARLDHARPGGEKINRKSQK